MEPNDVSPEILARDDQNALELGRPAQAISKVPAASGKYKRETSFISRLPYETLVEAFKKASSQYSGMLSTLSLSKSAETGGR